MSDTIRDAELAAHLAAGTRPRDIPQEHYLTRLAAGSRYELPAKDLSDFADERALPGGVRTDLDGDTEAREELADCRNYVVWELQANQGDDTPAVAVANRLRFQALHHVVRAHQLLTEVGE